MDTEVTKVYEIVKIALLTNMSDIIHMADSNTWFELLDDNICVTDFQHLITLAKKTNYFEYIVNKFPKNISKCSKQYIDFQINIYISLIKKESYYYENSEYSLITLISQMYNGCIINHNGRLYIVIDNKCFLLHND